MSTTATKKYRLVKRVKDEGFSVDDLHDYELSLLIGTRDFQFSVTSAENKVVLFEDYLPLFSGSAVPNSNTRCDLSASAGW